MRLLLMVLAIFMLNGCSTNKSISKDAFNVMCNKYELSICGDFSGDTYNEYSIEEIQSYARNLFQSKYIYTSDRDDGKDYYDYMEGYPLRGDCEDLVITLLEDLIVRGMVNDAEWVFGTINGRRHAWLLVKVDGETYIFDTQYRYGTNIVNATGYIKEFVVYKIKE